MVAPTPLRSDLTPGKPAPIGDTLAVAGVGLARLNPGSFRSRLSRRLRGSGKSTLLKMVNTLVEPTGGRVLFGGEERGPRCRPPGLRRRVGYVFQGIGLFPHMTVGERYRHRPAPYPARSWRMNASPNCSNWSNSTPLLPAGCPMNSPAGSASGSAWRDALAGEPELLIMERTLRRRSTR